ncbi:MAG: 30S ribosomal protein S5 [Nanoarchaeota archaeon]|nr:30S ribosomal protein S5 [Nanoarchaeota archaeon]
MADNQNQQQNDLDNWKPKTEIGRKVKSGEIKNIDEILGSGKKILEPEIVDTLLKTESELLLVGQAKGKFGGGQRRVFRQTQKKTREGNKPKFATMAVVGDRNGHVGIGFGKSKETVPAREKAFAQAKTNMMMIRRGSGSWEDDSNHPHSIPFAVEGKCGSYTLKLMPAPNGKGLICDKEVAKVLALAGVKNVWSKSFGQTKNKINVLKATVSALRKLSQVSVQQKHRDTLAIAEGSVEVKAHE